MNRVAFKIFLVVLYFIICFHNKGLAHTHHPTNIKVVAAIYEPFVMYKNNQLVGFDIDILNEICKENALSYTITITSFSDMLQRIKEGKADLAIGCIYVTKERKKNFHFSDSYLEDGLVIVVPVNSKVKELDDLDGKKLGVKKNATGELFAKRLLTKGYKISIEAFVDTKQSFDALTNGDIDAVLNDYLNSIYLINKFYTGDLKITRGIWGDIIYDRSEIAFPIAQNSQWLIPKINKSLEHLKAQKVLEFLYWKWFAVLPPPNLYIRIALYIGGIILAILLTVFIIQLYNRRKKIQYLRNIETHFRTLVEELTVGLYILIHNKIVLINNEGARIANTSADEAIGKSLDEFFSNYIIILDNELQYPTFQDLIRSLKEKTIACKGKLIRKDNAVIHVLLRIRHVTWMGSSAIECVMNDMTEFIELSEQRDQLKGQLLQSQKLEIIGQIAGGIAHDFNNVLTVIMGYANILEKSINEKDKIAIKKIIEAGNHAKDIISKLLTFARKKPQRIDNVRIHDIINTGVSLLFPSIQNKCQIAKVFNAYNDHVLGDYTQIQQMVMNIMINAVEAMPYGGTLSIITENVIINSERMGKIEKIAPGEYILIAISDTGIGIKTEDIEHIFEPFFTTKEKGSGLGLAIVYGVVKQHKGFIDVSSHVGEGTTFYVYLPITKIEAHDANIDAHTHLQVIYPSILFIDDDDHICELYSIGLQKRGIYIKTFTNPYEALEYIDKYQNTIQIVLCDLRMPVITGEEVLQQIRKKYPNIKVIVITSYFDEEVKQRLLRMGAYDVWHKTHDLDHIVEKLKGVIV